MYNSIGLSSPVVAVDSLTETTFKNATLGSETGPVSAGAGTFMLIPATRIIINIIIDSLYCS